MRRLEANLLSVCVTTVANRNNIDQTLAVGYTINNSPIADSNAPKIRGAFELSHPARTRLHGESLNALENPNGNRLIQCLKFLAR